MGVGVLCVFLTTFYWISQNPSDKLESGDAEWKNVTVEGGPLKGTISVKIEDYEAGSEIRSWDHRNYPWFEPFVAAKGMHTLNYEQFKMRVSESFLMTTGLADKSLFDKMTSVGLGAPLPDYSVFRAVYLNWESGAYVFVSCWNNRTGSQLNEKIRIEKDGKTKYRGSWIPMVKQGGDYILVSPSELESSSVNLFPYFDEVLLNYILSEGVMIWNTNENKYIPQRREGR